MDAMCLPSDWDTVEFLVPQESATKQQYCALQVLLLDEITVDLDVLARADFLKFLVEDCETRGMTIVYVSSIHYAGAFPTSCPAVRP